MWLILLRRYWKAAGATLLLIAIAAAVMGVRRQLQQLRFERDSLRTAEHNARAQADTVRAIYQTDSATTYARLALITDSLGQLRQRLKGGQTKTAVTGVVTAKPVAVVHTDVAPVVQLPGVLVFTDSVVGPPTDVLASVRVPPPDSVGDSLAYHPVWSWRVQSRPITFTVDVGCKADFEPDVYVTTPPWLQVDSIIGAVKPGVCAKPAKPPSFSFKRVAIGTTSVAAAIALLVVLLK